MKPLINLIFLISVIASYAQIPAYYNDVNLNLSGNALRNELSTKVIATHTNFLSYTPGVWNALKQADVDPTNSSRVILIYGWNDSDGTISNDRTRGINNNGGASTDWNREHVYPRSLGNPNLGSSGAGSDAHSLRPCDPARNSSRGNRKFADGNGNSGGVSSGWYPGNEWKGDVARMMMYMYIRYGNQCLPRNVGVGTSVSSDSNMIDLFLEWNAEDPVSSLEIQRNSALVGIQGNRNPFIDNPAFATQIWGGPQAQDRFGNSGGGSGGGNNNELFISEYIEGSSNNKALEIGNLSGNTVNLSSYSLRKATNGSDNFSTVYNLSGQLSNGQVYVIANSNASSTIRNKANTTTSSGIVTFNGNDAIGLFKNGTLIDLIGNPSSSSNFAQNVTLQRVSSVNSPSSTYISSQWNRLSVDNSSGLGTISGGSNNTNICDGVSEWRSNINYTVGSRVTYLGNLFERTVSGWTLIGACGSSRSVNTSKKTQTPPLLTTTFNVFPNPAEQFLNINLSIEKEASFQIVNYLGQVLLKGMLSSTNEKIDIINLDRGNYILQINQDEKIYTKHIIKR